MIITSKPKTKKKRCKVKWKEVNHIKVGHRLEKVKEIEASMSIHTYIHKWRYKINTHNISGVRN